MIESQSGYKCRSLWSDCGSEFLNQKVRTLLAVEHCTIYTSAPRTPQQNGKSERSNRTIIELARTMLTSSGLPETLWGEACCTAAYLHNRVNLAGDGTVTPFEKWFHRKPDLSHIHSFGLQIQILDKPRSGTKWSPKTRLAHLVGYTQRRNTYRCFVSSDDEVRITCDVIFRSHPQQTKQGAGNSNTGVICLLARLQSAWTGRESRSPHSTLGTDRQDNKY